MKRIAKFTAATILGLGISVVGVTAAQAATYECHVFKDRTVVCRELPPDSNSSIQL